MNTAVVTGANGFVGKAVCKALAAEGVKVYAVVRSGAKHLDGLEKTELISCNLNHYDSLSTKLKNCDAEVFYHFAWTGTAGPLRDDEKVQLANVQSTCDAVRAASEIGCSRFVFAASIMQYEVAEQMKNGLCGPGSIYSTAKLTADYMARAIAEKEGIQYLAGLISNIYGPGETSPRLINSTIRKLLKGEHVAFSPGNQLYDFIYVDDAASFFSAIGEKGRPGKTYYIGNKTPRPLKEFLLEVRDVVSPGCTLGLGELPFRGISLTYIEFDTKTAETELGVMPRVSFPEGIAKTRDWILEQGV